MPEKVRDALGQAAADLIEKVLLILRGNVNFHEQVTKSHIFSYQHTAGAGNPQTVDLTPLKITWTPSYFLLLGNDTNLNVVSSTAADQGSWSSTQIVLRCSLNNSTVTVMVF